MDIVLSFFIYSFLGWCCECIYCGLPARKWINRGFLAGPYCPVYGFGALAVLFLLKPFVPFFPLLFVMGIFTTSALEYITSYLMEELFHTKWWDYSQEKWNLNGRICLKNSLLFGLMALLVVYVIHPHIITFIHRFPSWIQGTLLLLLVACFVYDVLNTTLTLLRKNKDFKQVETCMYSLLDDFHNTKFHPTQENLREFIQRVLDSTTADELLLTHLDKFKRKMDALYTHHHKTQKRLAKAFPNRLERASRLDAQSIFKLLNTRPKKKEK